MNRHPGAEHRGRNAEHPSDIPARGWLDILWRVVKRMDNDNVSLVAGGVRRRCHVTRRWAGLYPFF